jgi:hypothetical protein
VALVRIERGAEPLGELAVQVEVLDGHEKPVRSQTLRPLLKEALHLTLSTAGLPTGTFRVRARLLGPGGQVLASAEKPLRKLMKRKQRAEPAQGRVALRVWPAAEDQPGSWPIATGVPFPQGELFSAERVRLLDDRGREVPCQTTVRALWNRRGSVRWLGLDFAGQLTRKGATYTLEYGRDVRRAKAPSRLVVKAVAEGVRVNTGLLQFTIRQRGFNLLDGVRLQGRPIAAQDGGGGLVVTDQEGTVYRAANDLDTKVTIEESGPVKAVIRVAGWYVKAGTTGAEVSPVLPTDRLCQHITRLTAYAGKPYVQVQHVWVVTCDMHRVRLRNVAIGVGLPGGTRRARSRSR